MLTKVLLTVGALGVASFAVPAEGASVAGSDARGFRARFTTADSCVYVYGERRESPSISTPGNITLGPTMRAWAYVYGASCAGPYQYFYGNAYDGDPISVSIDPTLTAGAIVGQLSAGETILSLSVAFAADPEPPPLSVFVDPDPLSPYVSESFTRDGIATGSIQRDAEVLVAGEVTDDGTYAWWSAWLSVNTQL